jgi:hypothetical protein
MALILCRLFHGKRQEAQIGAPVCHPVPDNWVAKSVAKIAKEGCALPRLREFAALGIRKAEHRIRFGPTGVSDIPVKHDEYLPREYQSQHNQSDINPSRSASLHHKTYKQQHQSEGH